MPRKQGGERRVTRAEELRRSWLKILSMWPGRRNSRQKERRLRRWSGASAIRRQHSSRSLRQRLWRPHHGRGGGKSKYKKVSSSRCLGHFIIRMTHAHDAEAMAAFPGHGSGLAISDANLIHRIVRTLTGRLREHRRGDFEGTVGGYNVDRSAIADWPQPRWARYLSYFTHPPSIYYHISDTPCRSTWPGAGARRAGRTGRRRL